MLDDVVATIKSNKWQQMIISHTNRNLSASILFFFEESKRIRKRFMPIPNKLITKILKRFQCIYIRRAKGEMVFLFTRFILNRVSGIVLASSTGALALKNGQA